MQQDGVAAGCLEAHGGDDGDEVSPVRDGSDKLVARNPSEVGLIASR